MRPVFWSWPTLAKPTLANQTLANFSVLVFWPNFVVDGGCLFCCCVLLLLLLLLLLCLWLWVWTPPDQPPPDRPPPDRPPPDAFGLSGCRVKPPAAPPDQAAGARTRQPENSKRAHFRAPALQTPPKFHEKTPRETQKERNGGGKGKKKREILGTLRGPTLRGPTLRGPPFGAPLFLGLGPPTLRGPTLPPFGAGLAKVGQLRLAKVGLAKVGIGQSLPIRMAKVGLAKVGLSPLFAPKPTKNPKPNKDETTF